jgi:hypothetical protein
MIYFLVHLDREDGAMIHIVGFIAPIEAIEREPK